MRISRNCKSEGNLLSGVKLSTFSNLIPQKVVRAPRTSSPTKTDPLPSPRVLVDRIVLVEVEITSQPIFPHRPINRASTRLSRETLLLILRSLKLQAELASASQSLGELMNVLKMSNSSR